MIEAKLNGEWIEVDIVFPYQREPVYVHGPMGLSYYQPYSGSEDAYWEFGSGVLREQVLVRMNGDMYFFHPLRYENNRCYGRMKKYKCDY